MKATDQFDDLVIYGARGTAEMVLSDLQEARGGRVRVRALVDDLNHGFDHPRLSAPVISAQQRLERFPDTPVLLMIGDGSAREKVALRLAAEGAMFATFCGNGPGVRDAQPQLGPGSYIPSFTRVGPNVRLGACVLVHGDFIAHDVTVGDFTNIGVRASIYGHVEIEDHVIIGPNAIVGNGSPDKPIRIGAGAALGFGCVVTRDVPPGARLVGNPAMPSQDWAILRKLIKDAQS
ncbi:hypothetical protein [Ottowia thiooxydans]|uniref:hypothetical protein n=1 Tax=Ottowia thiooxydans TaxID=219182 RepID=UPI0004047765|nr:hypothetical protein [Ottowia thiooxydans]